MNRLRPFYHYFLSWLGNLIYRNPSKEIFVLGVTGTKGKSTTLEIISAILETAGKKTALLSSIRKKIGKESKMSCSGMTMPGRFEIKKFLREAADKGCDYALLEVTSQGVIQHRHCFIDFDAAILTNLEPEHIESHGSFENYRSAKADFFRYVAESSKKSEKWFFINSEAKDKNYFLEATEGKNHIILYSRKDMENLNLKTKLLGDFNKENIAAAIAFARSQNISWDVIKTAVENFEGVPGRFEFVQKDPFSVIVDYAHTPDSLEKVYKSVRNLIGNKKMVCVLGAAGGGRDVWKRPVMGKIASQYCDEIILTNEDPFDEDPAGIINQIESGMPKGKPTEKLLDRKEAIYRAVKKAEKGGAVVITGKGCEPFIRVKGGKKIPWSEKGVVLEFLAKFRGAESPDQSLRD